ncbi:MAG: GtrA family protein [Sphingomonadaceae bacterium]
MYKTLLSRFDEHQLKTLGQLARYVFSGGFVTLLHLGVYWTAAQPLKVAPLIANIMAQIVSTTIGYVIHSRWTFQGHGRRDNLARTGGRFLAVTAFGFLLNSCWVWLFTGLLAGPVWWPMPAIAILTPLAVFWLNRLWVFS